MGSRSVRANRLARNQKQAAGAAMRPVVLLSTDEAHVGRYANPLHDSNDGSGKPQAIGKTAGNRNEDTARFQQSVDTRARRLAIREQVSSR